MKKAESVDKASVKSESKQMEWTNWAGSLRFRPAGAISGMMAFPSTELKVKEKKSCYSAQAIVERRAFSAWRESNLVCCTTIGISASITLA